MLVVVTKGCGAGAYGPQGAHTAQLFDTNLWSPALSGHHRAAAGQSSGHADSAKRRFRRKRSAWAGARPLGCLAGHCLGSLAPFPRQRHSRRRRTRAGVEVVRKRHRRRVFPDDAAEVRQQCHLWRWAARLACDARPPPGIALGARPAFGTGAARDSARRSTPWRGVSKARKFPCPTFRIGPPSRPMLPGSIKPPSTGNRRGVL